MVELATACQLLGSDFWMRMAMEGGFGKSSWNSWAQDLQQRLINLTGNIQQLKQEIANGQIHLSSQTDSWGQLYQPVPTLSPEFISYQSSDFISYRSPLDFSIICDFTQSFLSTIKKPYFKKCLSTWLYTAKTHLIREGGKMKKEDLLERLL